MQHLHKARFDNSLTKNLLPRAAFRLGVGALATAVAVTTMLGHALGQEKVAEPAQQNTSSSQKDPQQPVNPDQTPEAIEKAKAIAMESAKAYHEVVNLKDDILVRTTDPTGSGQDQTLTISLGEGTNARLVLGRMKTLAIDGTVYIINGLIPDKYAELPMRIDLVNTIQANQGPGFPIPHFALRRAASAEQAEIAMTIVVGRGRFTGYREVTDDQTGEKLDEILATGPRGDLRVRLDRNTHFIKSMHLLWQPPEGGGAFKADFTFKPVVHDQLPEPIAFDPGDRVAVPDLAQLTRVSLEQGDPLPAFSATDIEGKTHDFAKFDQDAEMIVFFSIGLVNVETLLDTVQNYVNWVHDEGLSVKVLAVSILENNPGEQLKKELAAMWANSEYTYPVIMDVNDEIAITYPLMARPCIMFVDKERKVNEQYFMIMVETDELKEATRRLLDIAGPEGKETGTADESDKGGSSSSG